MNIWGKLSAAKTYFSRGHSIWLIYIPWFLSTISVVYVLFGSQVPILYVYFPNIFVFAGLFSILYVFLGIAIGRFDVKKGTYRTESSIYFRNNPEWQAMRKDVDALTEKMDTILEKLEQLEGFV